MEQTEMKTPETIYLQWFGDMPISSINPDSEDGPVGWSWHWERVYPGDIEYMRKDAATEAMRMMQAEYKEMAQQVADLKQMLCRYKEREATMGWNQS
jgi:hypothetical protein